MRDLVNPLKFEADEDFGAQVDLDDQEDYLSAKGIVLEGDENYHLEKDDTTLEMALADPVNGRVLLSKLLEKASEARVSILLSNNGTLGGNDWLGYASGISSDDTPVVLPWASTLREVTFSNRRNSVDGNLVFYKNGTDPSDAFFTWIFTNVDFVDSISGLNFGFAANDFLAFQWEDTGRNPSDVAVVLYLTLNS